MMLTTIAQQQWKKERRKCDNVLKTILCLYVLIWMMYEQCVLRIIKIFIAHLNVHDTIYKLRVQTYVQKPENKNGQILMHTVAIIWSLYHGRCTLYYNTRIYVSYYY